MCSTIAGPVCTRLMADFGAEVIKIEPPEGDAARNMGLQDQGESLYCASMLRNKQTVCIDLKTPEGKKLVRELVARPISWSRTSVPARSSGSGSATTC